MGLILLIVITVLSIKFAVTINRYYGEMVAVGIGPLKIRSIQVSSLLYVLPVVAMSFPFSWLIWLTPIPFGFLLLIPGIVLGKLNAMPLERSGKDVGVEAGRAVANVMWLGIAIVIYMIGSVTLSVIIHSYKG